MRVTGRRAHAAAGRQPADLKDSLEFSLAFAEAVLGLQTGDAEPNPTQELVRGYLAWVGQVIPADTTDEELLAMRVRALDLGGYAPNSPRRAFVPILPAADYEASIDRIMGYLQEIQRQIAENTIQVNQRKQAELTIDVGKTLNKNIIESGELLTGLIKRTPTAPPNWRRTMTASSLRERPKPSCKRPRSPTEQAGLRTAGRGRSGGSRSTNPKSINGGLWS